MTILDITENFPLKVIMKEIFKMPSMRNTIMTHFNRTKYS